MVDDTLPVAGEVLKPGETQVERDGLAGTVVASQGTASAPLLLPPASYQLGAVIGRGGMGEVLAARDQRIGRDVAVKRMRHAGDATQLARFLREAKIQARLDHPAIVPVHELGTDSEGRPYFTMKRIAGKTLAQCIADGASQQSLLRAFVDVCLAIDLAHSRAVIHRDLKPSNVMLGDYGEVYVLDWGVARVIVDDTEITSDVTTLEGENTQTGAMLGTPGYMSPEQIRGTSATGAADVYALGAILFEILTGEPLHPRGPESIQSTLAKPQQSPAKRVSARSVASDVVMPPELDAVCFAALDDDQTKRPTVRALADRVQAYLDGDRDLERRRTVSAEHMRKAREGMQRGDAEGRATAIREAGLALALTPTSADAGALLTAMLVEPPDPLPPDIKQVLTDEEKKVTRERARFGVTTYLALFLFWPVFPFLGIKSWPWLIALYVVVVANAAATWFAARSGRYNLAIGLVGNLVLAVVWTRLAGTFLTTPVFVCGVLLALTTSQWLYRRPWAIAGYAALATLIPVVLEAVGILPGTWQVTRTAIISHSTIFEMEGPIADGSLVFGTIIFTAMCGLVAARSHRAARDAKRKLSVQAWHLRQLLPRGTAVTRSH